MIQDPIGDCDRRFGHTPRTFSLWDRWTYLRIDRPLWLRQSPDDKLNSLFRHANELLREGQIVWGCVIQANTLLMEPGRDDHPGEMVYTLADPSRVSPSELHEVAARIAKLKGTAPDRADLAEIAHYLTDQSIRVLGLEVPRSISPSFPCRISTVMFFRKHLPNRRLTFPLLPILVNPREPYVALPLPVRYWSPELITWWTQSAPGAERDSHAIDPARLPAVVRIGQGGFALSLAGLSLGGLAVKLIDIVFPGVKGQGVPAWLWPILVGIWTPGIVGLLLTFYAIARYPYLNLATGGGPRIAAASRWIWAPLGWFLYVLAPLVALSALANIGEPVKCLVLLFMALDMAFVAFLLTFYRREKHPTVATFLELTFGLGTVLFPIYIPSLVIGSLRCRRFLQSLPSGPPSA